MLGSRRWRMVVTGSVAVGDSANDTWVNHPSGSSRGSAGALRLRVVAAVLGTLEVMGAGAGGGGGAARGMGGAM